jgi:hypothetical protein
MKMDDNQINELTFNLAVKYDKRKYFEYYISLLKEKHLFIFSFINNDDYNSKIIKIDLFFINFVIYFTINSLFYDDDTMHHIYIKKGSFDLEYKLPKIIYSTIISSILNIFLKMFALYHNNISEFKNNKNQKNIDLNSQKLINKIIAYSILFFIISLIFLLFFWYYISMFCTIYKNTQYHLIKDTLISFGLTLVYPFGIYLIPGFFRIPALAEPKKKRILLYKISKFLHTIF